MPQCEEEHVPASKPANEEEEHVPASKPANEEERLRFLHSLSILDSLPDESIDDITVLLSHLFKVPIVLVSIVDKERQWFKAKVGLDATETERKYSFCAHTLLPETPEVLLIPDAMQDPRFRRNALVLGPPHIRFYCGAPITVQGQRLGTLCLIDTLPRADMSRDKAMLLANFADMVAAMLVRSRIRNQQFDLVSHPCAFLELGGGSPSDWRVCYVNKLGLPLLEGKKKGRGTPKAGSSPPGLEQFSDLLFSDIVTVKERDLPPRSATSNESVVVFNGRLRNHGQGTCLCYLHPSRKQVRPFSGPAHSDPIAFPYQEPIADSQAQVASAKAEDLQVQPHIQDRAKSGGESGRVQSQHAFVVIKTADHLAIALSSKRISKSQKGSIEYLTSVKEFEQFVGPRQPLKEDVTTKTDGWTETEWKEWKEKELKENKWKKKEDADIKYPDESAAVSVVLFTSLVCKSCTDFHSFFATASMTYKEVARFAEVDIEASRELTEKCIGSSFFVPQTLFYNQRGKQVATVHGSSPRAFREQLMELIGHQFGQSDSTTANTTANLSESQAPSFGESQDTRDGFAASTLGAGAVPSNGGDSNRSVQPQPFLGRLSASCRSALGGRLLRGMARYAPKQEPRAPAGGSSQSASGLLKALSAEQAYSRALEGVIGAIETSCRDRMKPDSNDVQQARLELLQRQMRGISRNRRPRRGMLPNVAEDEVYNQDDNAGAYPSELPVYAYNATIRGFLEPHLLDCKVIVYGQRADKLVQGMQECDLDASLGQTCGGEISVAGRNGRQLVILRCVSCRNGVHTSDWFIRASDALPVNGVYIIMSSDEDTLEVMDALAECCGWESIIADDPSGAFAIIVMKKGPTSDNLLRLHYQNLKEACRDAEEFLVKAEASRSGKRSVSL